MPGVEGAGSRCCGDGLAHEELDGSHGFCVGWLAGWLAVMLWKGLIWVCSSLLGGGLADCHSFSFSCTLVSVCLRCYRFYAKRIFFVGVSSRSPRWDRDRSPIRLSHVRVRIKPFADSNRPEYSSTRFALACTPDGYLTLTIYN